MNRDKPINLVRLCRRISTTFSPEHLRALCGELDIDGTSFHFHGRPIAVASVVALVARMHEQGRIEELISACARRFGVFTAGGFEIPRAEWTLKPLSENIIRNANLTLGVLGKPYFTYSVSDYRTWILQRVETGCYGWRIGAEALEETLSTTPELSAALEKVRATVAHDVAFAYIGMDRLWTNLGMTYFPCIIVAPTIDQFDSIRIEQTNESKGDIEPEGLIDELSFINERYGVDILAAGESTVEFRLMRLPKGQKATFTRWLRKYAPLAYEVYRFESRYRKDDLIPIRLYWD